MSALARYFAEGGFHVGGYDRTASSLTRELQADGIHVTYKDDPGEIPSEYLDREKALVIYTPAIPPVNEIASFFRTSGYSMYKRAEILGLISKRGRTIAIAGTHGKTSLTTMTAHLLKQSSIDCTAFLGGISKNYMTNMLTGTGDIIVMEADEYDRSFHHLNPHMALITSVDADHLDVYGSHENMLTAYREFTERINEGGRLLVNEKIAARLPGPQNVELYTYGLEPDADFYAGEISLEKGEYQFNIHCPGEVITDLCLLIPGKMNIENTVGAVALAKMAGVQDDEIRKALIYYMGVKRRFDVRISSDELIYIDDYAHHPAEIDHCIESVREFYGEEKKICGIFQPHLFTRTRDHADAFAASLDKLDRLILLPVYPAREEEIEGVDSGMIFDRMKLKDRILAGRDEVLEILGSGEIDILLTMGAGDIDRLVEPIENLLKERL